MTTTTVNTVATKASFDPDSSSCESSWDVELRHNLQKETEQLSRRLCKQEKDTETTRAALAASCESSLDVERRHNHEKRKIERLSRRLRRLETASEETRAAFASKVNKLKKLTRIDCKKLRSKKLRDMAARDKRPRADRAILNEQMIPSGSV